MARNYDELPEPKPSTVRIPARTVEAIRIATLLWQNGEQYHAGAIGCEQWKAKNVALWGEAEAGGVVDDVKARLRKAQ